MKKYLTCLMVLIILAGLTGCEGEDNTVSELLEPVGVQVDTAEVLKGDIVDITMYNGEIVPYVEELYFAKDGYLEKMNVALGDFVEKGQILATINEEDLSEQIAVLEEEIAGITKLGELADIQANADIEIAKLELKIMWEEGEVTQWQTGADLIDYNIKYVETEQMQLSLKQTQELRQLELQEKQRQLNILKEKEGKNKIIAPFDGRVVYISEFDMEGRVQEYKTVICLADESNLSLVSDFIPESDIENADKVYARILDQEYDLTYQPYASGEYLAMVLSGEEMKTKFSVDAQEGGLESGQFAIIMLLESCKENVLTIPGNALYRDKNGQFVYKMVDGQRIRCNVTVGITTDVKAEIQEGLQEGDVVYVKE